LKHKWQNIYRFQESTLLKGITEKPLHKHQKKVREKLKKELNTEDIIVMKADKNKAMVLVDRKQGLDRVHKFQKKIIFQLSNRKLLLYSKTNSDNNIFLHTTSC